MKVKITYTVNLEEVPGKADPVLQEAVENIAKISELSLGLKDAKDDAIEKCLKKIEEIRQLLADTDIVLGDCESMLAGYLNLMTQQEVQE